MCSPDPDGYINQNLTYFDLVTMTTSRGDRQMAAVVHNLNLLIRKMEELSQSILTEYQLLSEKNQPNGYAGLDASGLIPPCLLPDLNIPKMHNQLTNRDAADCHPIEAITGLQGILDQFQVQLNNLNAKFSLYQRLSDKNIAGGYAGLDGDGKIPLAFLPDMIQLPITTDDVITSVEWTLDGVSYGQWKDGMIIPAGTTLTDVLGPFFRGDHYVTYYQPTLTLTGTPSPVREVGTQILINILPDWTQNDAGNSENYKLWWNDTVYMSVTNPAPAVGLTLTFTEEQQNFKSAVTYGEGPVKNDDTGTPHPAGHILAGTIESNLVTYTGNRALFFGGNDSRTVPATSLDIRALANSRVDLGNGMQFLMNVPTGSWGATIAIDERLNPLTSIYYTAGAVSDEYINKFGITYVDVEGANGYSPVRYRVYCYLFSVATLGEMNFIVTIGS